MKTELKAIPIQANDAIEKILFDELRNWIIDSSRPKRYTRERTAYIDISAAFLRRTPTQITVPSVIPGQPHMVKILVVNTTPGKDPSLDAAFESEFGPDKISGIIAVGYGPTEMLAGCRAIYAYLSEKSLNGQYEYCRNEVQNNKLRESAESSHSVS
jgi:hypothetical protein